MNLLLTTLGTSWAIVPEAFRFPGVSFDAVHVLTSDSVGVENVSTWFQKNAPDVQLTITRVAGFTDLQTEADHFHFEEVLYRWWIASFEACKVTTDAPSPKVFACLSGGFKTMSAAVQKAATVLGADEVFHVLADAVYPLPEGGYRPANTDQEIAESLSRKEIHWVKLGPERGWPQLRAASTQDYPLTPEQPDAAGTRRVSAADPRFRTVLAEVVDQSHRIASSWQKISDYPFTELATWRAEELEWLDGRLDPTTDRDWISKLPKIELHCHLGGFATSGVELEGIRLAAEAPQNVPAVKSLTPPKGWPMPENAIGLESYRKLGDNNGRGLLSDRGCLREQCRQLYSHLVSQNVAYAEIRCSPANYATAARSPWTVLCDIKSFFDECMRESVEAYGARAPISQCRVNLLVIGTRQESGDYRAGISRHLALATTGADHWRLDLGCRVVGVDLAGFEDKSTRAHFFREEFTAAHRCGLALTVHAGENDDAEGIWSAVFDLNARRIGHGLHLADCPELLHSIAARGIGIEMCPYANYQIKGFHPMHGSPIYPLKKYLQAGVKVSVNTDNIGISAASIGENVLFLATLCSDLTRKDILTLLRNAIDTAFLSPADKTLLLTRVAAQLPKP